MAVKYVFVTGGVVSGLGKGITAASLGRLLKARGYQVTMQKFDPYINVDPGTMNPIQHGEVFVTDDGTETDLDLGHYERFIDESLDKNSNVTTGKIYWSVLQKERHGDYGGGTVQVIPHITNEIKDHFYKAKSEDENRIAIIEVGGTVGDIESQPFLEAIRQFQHEIGHENAVLIHVTLIPYLKASGEMKTKPTQQSVKELQGMGLWPDVLVCRSEYEISEEMKAKIALFCNVPVNHVLQNLDVEYLYEAPLAMEEAWHLEESKKYYINHHGTTILAFTVPKKDEMLASQDNIALRIAAAHTDYPCMRIKTSPDVKTKKYHKLNVEVYGGAILNTWLDRPLGIAGRVALRSDKCLHPQMRLYDSKRPLATIPNLAIHMNREINKGCSEYRKYNSYEIVCEGCPYL